MAAERYKVQLLDGGSRLTELETNVDPRDYEAVRALLERLVKEKRGTLRLDLSRYRLQIAIPYGRPVYVSVNGGGETTIDDRVAKDYARR